MHSFIILGFSFRRHGGVSLLVLGINFPSSNPAAFGRAEDHHANKAHSSYNPSQGCSTSLQDCILPASIRRLSKGGRHLVMKIPYRMIIRICTTARRSTMVIYRYDTWISDSWNRLRNPPPFGLEQRHAAHSKCSTLGDKVEQELEPVSLRGNTSGPKVGGVLTFTRLKESFSPHQV
jgi:hypothetical protein